MKPEDNILVVESEKIENVSKALADAQDRLDIEEIERLTALLERMTELGQVGVNA